MSAAIPGNDTVTHAPGYEPHATTSPDHFPAEKLSENAHPITDSSAIAPQTHAPASEKQPLALDTAAEQPAQTQAQPAPAPDAAVPAVGTAPAMQPSGSAPGSPTSSVRRTLPAGAAAGALESGHALTKTDKKAIKDEMAAHKKYDKTMQLEAKAEAKALANALKELKAAVKADMKAAKTEAKAKKALDKAVAKEYKNQQKLNKIKARYDVAATALEKAKADMELESSNHNTLTAMRQEKQGALDELRSTKAQHDNDREHQRGEVLATIQQGKEALGKK